MVEDKCGCGRPIRYETATGFACNKYFRCATYEELREEIQRLRLALYQASDDIAEWGAYASPYFQEKHDLEGCIQKYRDMVIPKGIGGRMKDNGFTHESHKAQTVEWYTPPWVFEQLGCVFDLDVCAPQGGVEWIPAKKHIALPTNSLSEQWKGFVWCNPPYGKETKPFLKKMQEHGNGIALVFARTDTQWFHEYAAKADALLFIKGRVQFVDGSGKTSSSGSTCGSVLIGYGKHAATVLKNCSVDGMFVGNLNV